MGEKGEKGHKLGGDGEGKRSRKEEDEDRVENYRPTLPAALSCRLWGGWLKKCRHFVEKTTDRFTKEDVEEYKRGNAMKDK